MSKIKKILLIGCVAGLVITTGLLIMLQGCPNAAEFATALTARDPLLSGFLPGAGEGQSQTDPNYTLQDAPALYNPAHMGEVLPLLVEVYADRSQTLADFENPAIAAEVRLPAIVREGTDHGTVKWEGLGYSAVAPNATIEVRGTPRQNRRYHNFKLRLGNAAGQYEGQSILNLKKGYAKPCRVEEKFAFDLFSALPDMLSLRTRFVHLYIQDATAANPGYADYGLYTLVEQPDENYFINRSLDDSGNMYQAENFDFSLHPALLQVSDPAYKKDAFEQVLDIKQGDSHQNLLQMLEAVNDTAADIDQVVDTYFDRENLLTWMAMNAVLGNSDCVIQSYMIYKPTLSARWFFLPANMSDAMPAGGDDKIADVMISGCSMFYGNVLYERFLSKPANVQALAERVDMLMLSFSEDFVRQLTDNYIPVLARYLAVNPDRGMLKTTPEQVLARVAAYHRNMRLNVKAFHSNLMAPRRVELLEPMYRGQAVILSWLPSRQLGGGQLSYLLEVAADPGFTHVVKSITVAYSTQSELRGLPSGNLYWRVTVTDDAGRQSGSVNVTELADGSLLYGASVFTSL